MPRVARIGVIELLILLLLRESPSPRRHLLAALPRSSPKKAPQPRRSPSPQLHRQWQSASVGRKAAHAQRNRSPSVSSTYFAVSPSPRQIRPHLPTPSARQECCLPSHRFQRPTLRSRAPRQSVQSLSFRSAPFPAESALPIRSK